MTVLVFAKAITYFRGNRVVELDDLRQILPFVLHDKLQPDPDAPFFEAAGNAVLRIDRVSWIRRLFDLACAEYDRLNLDHDDPVGVLDLEFSQGLEGLKEADVRARLVKIERLLAEWSKGRKLYGNLFDDVLKLKYLHQRYTNYLRWLTYKKRTHDARRQLRRFAEILAAKRGRFNAQFAEARRYRPRLDQQDFADTQHTTVAGPVGHRGCGTRSGHRRGRGHCSTTCRSTSWAANSWARTRALPGHRRGLVAVIAGLGPHNRLAERPVVFRGAITTPCTTCPRNPARAHAAWDRQHGRPRPACRDVLGCTSRPGGGLARHGRLFPVGRTGALPAPLDLAWRSVALGAAKSRIGWPGTRPCPG